MVRHLGVKLKGLQKAPSLRRYISAVTREPLATFSYQRRTSTSFRSEAYFARPTLKHPKQ
ncbi:hypothetical protein J7K52_01000 [Candidatus Bathyarchaeota archaeon]|nr:hypothetical protein [Candidatus Bathyarchaeota archaeon]